MSKSETILLSRGELNNAIYQYLFNTRRIERADITKMHISARIMREWSILEEAPITRLRVTGVKCKVKRSPKEQ